MKFFKVAAIILGSLIVLALISVAVGGCIGASQAGGVEVDYDRDHRKHKPVKKKVGSNTKKR